MTEKEIRLPLPLGSVIAGRYRVDRIIGVGGMGVVVAATHLQLEQPIAIKFLRPDALESPEVVTRFMREARAAVRIKSEHVARVLDVGALDSGAPYMVMERLEGSDLAAHLRAKGPLSIETAVDYMLQTLEAVAEAHSLGIVHRDLKPGNLFLVSGRRAEVVKVLDFGISKTISPAGSATSGMTQTSAVFGTPAYMSPEQLNSARDVDARADVWSLGVILYELLTGQTPFRADTVPQLCVAIMNHPMPPLRVFRNDVPAGLEAVVKRCLEKERSQRFSSADDLALALAEYAPARSRAIVERLRNSDGSLVAPRSDGAGATVTVNPHVATQAVGENPVFSTQSEWGGTAPRMRVRSRRWILVAALLGTAVTIAGVIAAKIFAASDTPAGGAVPALRESAAMPTQSAGRLPQAPVESTGQPPNLSKPEVAATATPPEPTGEVAVVPQTSGGLRKSPIEKAARSGKPPGAGTRAAPASSTRPSERRTGSTEGWEDER